MTLRSRLSRSAALAATGLLALSLTACSGEYGGKETIGTLAGAALGAWAGSAIDDSGSGGVVAVAAGTVIGGLIGNQIGRGLDKVDRMEAQRTQFRTLEYSRSGESNRWYNPDSGNSGTYTARPAFRSDSGQVCREFTQTVVIGGRSEQGVGTACRQADGSWRIAGS
jgi:surface antigen